MQDNSIVDLIRQLGQDKVLTGVAVRQRYSHIWRTHEPLQAKAVVLPTCTEDVACIMRICHAHQQTVVVHGGLTNLVRSTQCTASDIVIALEKMDAIEVVDSQSRTITVEAGAILENVQQAASEKALLFPLNFGAKGSAQIGGAIATNAGGLRVVRFGMMRQLVLGLEVVLADGTIVSSLKKIIKDNSAYDIKQLFIGAEGTLGIITKAVLKLVERPKSRISAFVGLDSYESVVAFLKHMDKGLAGTLSAYELMWPNAYQAMTSPPASQRPPLPYSHQFYVLLESLGSQAKADRAVMEDLLATAIEKKQIADAVLTHNQSDLDWFWTIREDVRTIAARCTFDQHFDISLPIPLIGNYVTQTIQRLTALPAVEAVYTFGHIADGNIHFVVGKTNKDDALRKEINAIIYEPLQDIGGSVSAEHGIGIDKKDYLHLCRSEAEIQLMQRLKKSLDPMCLLNRGKVLDFYN